MKVTIEIDSLQQVKQVIAFLKELNIETFNIIEGKNDPKDDSNSEQAVTKGDKSVDSSELFGIWENDPRSLDDIRKNAWNREWN